MGEIAAKAASLILIIVIGYGIKRKGWVSAEDFPKISKIVLRITLPCALVTSFNNFDITYNLLFLTALGIVANLIQQVTGYLLNHRKGGKAQAFGIVNIGSYNVGAFAMPYIAGLMGPQSIIFASLFDVGNSFGAAGIGYGWARSVADEKEKTTVRGFLKLMFLSPLFDTYLFLLLMRLFDLQLPAAVITFTSTVGGANTFLAMLMIGIGLELGLDAHRFKLAFKYLAIRYGFSLLFSILIVLFLPVSLVVKTILCMLFFAPIASMATGFTEEAGGDVETSAFMNSVSILIGIFAMPLVLAIMG
ncbi:auxin efflux carrier [Trichococcus palustris]|uniref:Auxin efflux carrier n=1 Tax=Trichococcus palustris TaxID=140314 RepID=A0A143YQB7_9LACT|nr:hypothetical protein [Trichococcus palustris]CZQ96269.1 auxin efflux carrier [Trichococcus palustris]SFK73002.1 hypothetical protein SAMN04488076_10418 [Trichococcus palustris]